MNFALKPSRSSNLELGAKGRLNGAGDRRSEWSAAVFQTSTPTMRSSRAPTSAGAARSRTRAPRAGAGSSWPGAHRWRATGDCNWRRPGWMRATARTSAPAIPRRAPGRSPFPPATAFPGTAHSVTAAELAWQPLRGWRARAQSCGNRPRCTSTTPTASAAGSFSTWALHAGYVFGLKGWALAATARVDNLFDRRMARAASLTSAGPR